jgi:quercetin dioxygenase-like cupin family protein
VGHHETLDQGTGHFVTGHKSGGREVEGSMKKLLTALIPAAVLSAAAVATLAAPAPEKHVFQDNVSWTQPFGPKGPSFGFVEGKYGDKHPASFFVKMTAGGDSGWHTHQEDYSAIVIDGTFTEQQAADSAEVPLPVGSYFVQPSKVVHRNGCLKGKDCLIFVHFDKGAESTPTTREGKPIKM